jgi:hypothetical protein
MKLVLNIGIPSNAFLEGLASAPEDKRESLLSCAPLMKNLSQNAQHYFERHDCAMGSQAVSKSKEDHRYVVVLHLQ